MTSKKMEEKEIDYSESQSLEELGFVQIQDDDNAYKIALKRFFWDALEMGAPELYQAADTLKKPDFLDKEFEKIMLDLDGNPNRADMLVKVPLKGGDEKYVLWHAEQQGTGREDLPTRMARYRAMIFLKHEAEPAACAIITHNRPKAEADRYHVNTYGTKETYEYKNLNVKDLDDEMLKNSENRFAMILYAAKKSLESGKDEFKKFTYLREISDLWAKRGWSKEEKRAIMNIVEYLMKLRDKEYIFEWTAHFKEIEKEEEIMYVTIGERVGMWKGIEQGIEQGRLEGKLETAKRMLEMGVDRDFAAKATGLPIEEIDSL